VLFNLCISNLEHALEGGKPYICGYDFSVADLAYFNELTNVLAILDAEIDGKQFPNVDKWMKRISDIGPIRKSLIRFQEEFKKLQAKYNK